MQKKSDYHNKNTLKPNFWTIVLSILAAFIGVQSDKNRARDFKHGNIYNFIIAGIIFTIIFIIFVTTVVSSVINNQNPNVSHIQNYKIKWNSIWFLEKSYYYFYLLLSQNKTVATKMQENEMAAIASTKLLSFCLILLSAIFSDILYDLEFCDDNLGFTLTNS